MLINVTGHQIDLTTSLQHYVHEKLQRLERHYDQITQVHVVLNIEKLMHQAEATVHVSGSELFANAEATDMYAAIDLLSSKLDRQIIKHKEKVVDQHHGTRERKHIRSKFDGF
ncbi:MAG: ribosome-associated translation inhibitor RaiA [Pseudomonadota bacterium]|nr:ribosome-associated translation inhibitor RaiA [Pseudomonadota bacterium]